MSPQHTRLFSRACDARAEGSAPGASDAPATAMPGAQMDGIGGSEREEGGSQRGDVRREGDVRSEESGAPEVQDSANAELTGASDAFGDERGIDSTNALAEDETQLAAIRELMTRASARGVWLTLGEIAEATEFAEASISAQLRHLRKAQNGGHRVEKRHRRMPYAIARMRKAREARRGPVIWEYRVLSPHRGAEVPNAETCNRF
jgi:hypothetical protein